MYQKNTGCLIMCFWVKMYNKSPGAIDVFTSNRQLWASPVTRTLGMARPPPHSMTTTTAPRSCNWDSHLGHQIRGATPRNYKRVHEQNWQDNWSWIQDGWDFMGVFIISNGESSREKGHVIETDRFFFLEKWRITWTKSGPKLIRRKK